VSEHLKLGQVITTEQQRDCVHIAVAPMEAAEPLLAGMHVEIVEGRARQAVAGATSIGVVDPYLRTQVKAGQRFWLFMYPGSITSLRHEWGHPALPLASGEKGASERWLRELCDEIEFSYDRLIETVMEDDYSTGDNDDASYQLNDVINGHRGDLFWKHLENVVGKVDSQRYFRCAC
jgi:hypothetical protein